MDIDREIAIAHSAALRAHDAAYVARRAGDFARIGKTAEAARVAQARLTSLRKTREQGI